MSSLEREVREFLRYVDNHTRAEQNSIVVVSNSKLDGLRKALQELGKMEGPY